MFFSSSNSSSSSSSSSTKSMVEKLNKTKIVSCVLAMSKINWNSVDKNFAHAALLLIDTNSELNEEYRGTGIIIEYGDYSPTMSKEEEEAVKNNRVIYRYNNKGGLRYYAIDYKEYVKIFGDICYVSMDIESYNQMTFQYFLDTIAPTSENIWIKEKYSIGYWKNHNCQSFAIKALNLLKPKFNSIQVIVTDNARRTKKKIDIFPDEIKKVLETL